jgi:hypothetical protein
MATITQLATNTTLAPYLIPYRPTIGTISFFVVLAVTVAHIVGLAVYKYSEPEQQIATNTAKIQGTVIESALKELETRANEDKGILVDILAHEFRVDMLNALGFNQQLKRIGKQPALLPDSSEDDTADFDDLESLVDHLVEERMSQVATPYRVQIFNENRAMWEDKVSYPDLDTARWQVDTWVKESGELCRVYHNGREIYCPSPSAAGANPSPNGAGANFTHRPGGR